MKTVIEQTLVERINRKLKRKDYELCAAESDEERRALGYYFLVNCMSGNVVSCHVALGDFGLFLGALKQNEDYELGPSDFQLYVGGDSATSTD